MKIDCKYNHSFLKGYCSVHLYTTTSTKDAIYIIGGRTNAVGIAKYENGKWSKIADEFEKMMWSPQSITFGEQTMVFNEEYQTAQIWNLEKGKKLRTLKTPNIELHPGFGMFLINKNFCTKF